MGVHSEYETARNGLLKQVESACHEMREAARELDEHVKAKGAVIGKGAAEDFAERAEILRLSAILLSRQAMLFGELATTKSLANAARSLLADVAKTAAAAGLVANAFVVGIGYLEQAEESADVCMALGHRSSRSEDASSEPMSDASDSSLLHAGNSVRGAIATMAKHPSSYALPPRTIEFKNGNLAGFELTERDFNELLRATQSRIPDSVERVQASAVIRHYRQLLESISESGDTQPEPA